MGALEGRVRLQGRVTEGEPVEHVLLRMILRETPQNQAVAKADVSRALSDLVAGSSALSPSAASSLVHLGSSLGTEGFEPQCIAILSAEPLAFPAEVRRAALVELSDRRSEVPSGFWAKIAEQDPSLSPYALGPALDRSMQESRRILQVVPDRYSAAVWVKLDQAAKTDARRALLRGALEGAGTGAIAEVVRDWGMDRHEE